LQNKLAQTLKLQIEELTPKKQSLLTHQEKENLLAEFTNHPVFFY
jgi:hypothetical protein